MTITANLKFTDSIGRIQREIVNAMHNELSIAMRRAANSATPKIKEAVKNAIMSQPEVDSLIDGNLMYEFGIPDARNRLSNILDIWLNNTVILTRNQRGSTRFKYSFTFQMIQADYSDVLNADEALVKIVGGALPWLEWLLLRGDDVIVRDYDVEFLPGKNNRKSRTGMAIMVKGPNRQWSVPKEYAGDANNNFVTRAIEQIDNSILNIMEESLIQAL